MVTRPPFNTSSVGSDHYEALMLGYAAGVLDEAQALILSAHLALSRPAREFMSLCEGIGGALLSHYCAPVAMRENALEEIMSRLDRPAGPTDEPLPAQDASVQEDLHLPQCLQEQMKSCAGKKRWRSVYPGLEVYDLPLQCRSSAARFMRARPAFAAPRHRHEGLEIMLVLEGGLQDDRGRYYRGDLLVNAQEDTHATSACPKNGCVCLVVTSGAVRLTGLGALLNPFIRF